MVARAIAANPHFELSTMEMHEEGYSYTYQDAGAAERENPDVEYYFIIGADSLFVWMTG